MRHGIPLKAPVSARPNSVAGGGSLRQYSIVAKSQIHVIFHLCLSVHSVNACRSLQKNTAPHAPTDGLVESFNQQSVFNTRRRLRPFGGRTRTLEYERLGMYCRVYKRRSANGPTLSRVLVSCSNIRSPAPHLELDWPNPK